MPLIGDLVTLREEREDDMPFLTALRNDMATQAWSRALPPDYTVGMHLKRFNNREFSYDPDMGRFIIVHNPSDKRAGYIAFSGLQRRWAATIGIQVAQSFWGTKVAWESQEILLQFLFEQMGLRVVRLYTHSGNPRAIGLAQKAGFKVGIRQRGAVYKDGQLFDNITMDLLREEYYALHPELSDNLPSPI